MTADMEIAIAEVLMAARHWRQRRPGADEELAEAVDRYLMLRVAEATP